MPAPLDAFLTRWQTAGGAERANYQLFLTELCDLLQLPHPDPSTPDDSKNNYVFDRTITAINPDDTPPFLLVADVGYSIETYSDFSGLGKTYTPFPDNLSHRFKPTDLAGPAHVVREFGLSV